MSISLGAANVSNSCRERSRKSAAVVSGLSPNQCLGPTPERRRMPLAQLDDNFGGNVIETSPDSGAGWTLYGCPCTVKLL